MNDTGITPKLFNQVAQLGHFAGGAAIVLATVVLWHSHYAPLAGFGVVTFGAALKEFVYDEKFESAEVRGSSYEDFLFYMIGATAGVLAALAGQKW